MTNQQLIRDYLEVASPSDPQPDRVRSFLADDFTMTDPLMSAESADDFVEQLRALGASPGVETHVDAVVGEGDLVAALTRMEMGEVSVTFAIWYWIEDGVIIRQLTVYDPRPFLAKRD